MPGRGAAARWITWIGCFLFASLSYTVTAEALGESIEIEVNETHSVEYVRYLTPMTWRDAVRQCGQAEFSRTEQHLLCFESRAQMRGLLLKKDFNNIQIWLANKRCGDRIPEECLSLNIERNAVENESWNFAETCRKKLGFICRKFKLKKEEIIHPHNGSHKSCPGQQSRGIDWPQSPGSSNSSIKCPAGMKGYARWYCNGTTGEWGPGLPNLGGCRSVALTAVLQKMEVINLTETARSLHIMVGNLRTGGDVTTAVQILDRVEDIYLSQAPSMSFADRNRVAEDTSKHVVHTCDQLLSKSEAWNDLDENERLSAATIFLGAVDEIGGILASTIDKRNHSIVTKNVVLEVVKRAPKSPQKEDIGFRHSSSDGTNSLVVPVGSDTKHVVFAYYADLREILPNYQDNEKDLHRSINSAVLSANMTGKLEGKVTILLNHFDTESDNPLCVYWDTKSYRWNSDGCTLIGSNATHTECECTHLTNFAVLMDIDCSTCDLAVVHKVALSVITIIGCSISIFCLAICIIVFSVYRSLWGMRFMIHRNLCISLFVAQIILLVGLDRTENKTVCGCIAGLLQYFFLSAFFWMFLEAFHILWLLIKVFTPKQTHVVKFYLFGYGCPAIIVAVTAGVQPTGFGTETYCWLNPRDGTIWSFLGPIMFIILFNSVSLGYALFTTHRIVKSKEKEHLDGLKLWVRGAAVLMPLLGVTWVIGFFYIDTHSVIFAYIFAALNSLQGLGIFLFHCLLNKKVKEHISRTWERSSIRRSGLGRSTTKTSSSKTSSTKSSASPKRKKFFSSRSDSEPVSDQKVSSTEREEEDPENLEVRIAFLQPDLAKDRVDTPKENKEQVEASELYPLEVEK